MSKNVSVFIMFCTYIEIFIKHKIKTKQIKISQSFVQFIANALKTMYHDLLHTFLGKQVENYTYMYNIILWPNFI